ncbi:MAG TPA: GAP family protein [Acetobacteraceae bacterium]|jgi:hypothetical protein|nr:GAP family protein [Acetobacteraceae bacterium]
MGQAIAGSFALAVGIALSPLSIMAVVLMLTTERGSLNGAAFVIGWLLALGIIGVIVLAVAGPVSSSGEFAMWVSWLEIVLGTLVLVVAILQFRGRPRGGNQVLMPRWMGAINKLTPGAALAAGALLAAANPKNLLLSVVGAAAIARTEIGGNRQAIAYLVFVVIATIGVGAPVAIYILMGQQSQQLLARLKDWITRYSVLIMCIVCLIISALFIGDAVTKLTG